VATSAGRSSGTSLPMLMNFATRSFKLHPESSRSRHPPPPTATIAARTRQNQRNPSSPELILRGGRRAAAACHRLHPLEHRKQQQHHHQPPCSARRPWPPRLHRHNARRHKGQATNSKTSPIYSGASPFPTPASYSGGAGIGLARLSVENSRVTVHR
jgi:hypothetical protein